ncbi:glycine cleavage system H protein [Cyphellophora europaea CBS 101466]|uniref:Glycine cleavage system H protein n=1 Tax=Cyphellophora europaea (strain CBS 101466) TaxID=1220924 RepID=W2S8H6_CYPE1|nr:glycine cleavage system H protein [Cyphellophora europaea CBS 101466]ETN44972.1 glycine cleavage system H protein [Cyphellophora europaea CBS 101466]
MAASVMYRVLPVARAAARASVAPAFRSQVQASWRAGARRGFGSSSSLLVKKYTEDHEWIELDDGGKIGTIGITTYAAQQLGDVVFVELPEVGTELKKGDSMGAVESVKSASDINVPVGGTITEANNALEEKPGNINKSPEDSAWMAKIEVADASELENLMDAEAYKAFTDEGE